MHKIQTFFVISLCLGITCLAAEAWSGSDDRVRLRDVEVLTLYQGKMTAGRRASPVQQLKCVGGSAAQKYNPQVVQCYNRGFDGTDVQWECKTDMDNAYRFGNIQVSCEGYEYPDDPYILKGSCGLEYTLELTKEGHEQQQQQQQGDGYGGYYSGNSYGSSYNTHSGKSAFQRGRSMLADILFWCMIGLLAYFLYKMCTAGPASGFGGTSRR